MRKIYPHPLRSSPLSKGDIFVMFQNLLFYYLILFISRIIFPFDKGKYPKGEGIE